MLLSLAEWVQNLGFFSDLRGSAYEYPILLALHLSFISLFGAMIVVTDLRLLGWAFTDWPISDLVDRLRVPKRIGFVLAATCGFLLFCSKAEEYYYNAFFRVKISLFILVAVHAIVFRSGVYNRAKELDGAAPVPVRAKWAARLSLLLWTGILCAGRGIGYLPGTAGLHFN